MFTYVNKAYECHSVTEKLTYEKEMSRITAVDLLICLE